MPHLHILHLSDLHYSASADDDRRLEALLADVNLTLSRFPAQICFSGDLTYSGTRQEFDLLAKNFILQLKGYDRLFMCPGNHDVVRGRTGQEAVAEAQKKSAQVQEFNGTESPFGAGCPLNEYMSIQEALSDYSESNFFTSAGGGEDFQIISLNTAWSSFKRPDGYTDKGNLVVNQRAVDKAVKLLQLEKIKILMMHHPMSWLTSESQKYLHAAAAKNFDFVLSGHEHDPISSSIQTPKGSCIFIEATAAKADWCQGLNGYSLVSIDPSSQAVQVSHRSYSTNRDMFIDGVGVADGGKYYPRDSDKSYWVRELARDSSFILNRAAAETNTKSLRSAMEAAYASKFSDDFEPVVTKFSQIKFKNGEQDVGKKQAITDCLDSISSSAFFVGPKDSGLTTASQIAFRHIARNLSRFSAIPIYVSAEDVSSINKATLLREIQRGFVSRLTQTEAITLAETGSVFFLFDSVCIHGAADLSGIRSVVEQHFAKCRAAIFCSLDQRSTNKSTDGHINFDPVYDTVFEISQLDADEIKELIDKKAPGEPETTRENLLNNTVISFKAMDEPIYATTVSVLVDTLKQLPDFKPINRVRLLDRYIECLLGRYTLEDVEVGHFNSSEKSNLLSFMAGKMAALRKVRLTHAEVDQVISDYTEKMLLPVPKGILGEFFEKGILFSAGETITFRANSMFSYFVAKEMVRSQEVFRSITSEDCFFSYHNEVVFYGELEGVDNSGLLNTAEGYIQELEAIIVKQYADNGVDFAEEWRKLVSAADDSDPNLASAIETIASQVPSEAEKSISRSNDLNSEPRLRGVSSRDTIKEIEAKWLISIRVYLQLLKYSSSIPGPEKIRHLKTALASLERFAQNIAVKREMISTTPAFSHGGILYINPMAAFDVERSKREFKINANESVAMMASELMGTAQLGLALARVSDTKNEFHQYIIRNLLMDIPSQLNADFVVKSVVNSKVPTLQIASMRSLKGKYVSYRTGDAERRHHRSIIDGLNKEKNVRSQLNLKAIERKLSLEKMKNPDAFKHAAKDTKDD